MMEKLDIFICAIYQTKREKQITGSIYVNSENPDFQGANISIKWNISQEIVGLYIYDRLWAAFDLQGQKYGGNYWPGQPPEFPGKYWRLSVAKCSRPAGG
jgi:hypothetical protein